MSVFDGFLRLASSRPCTVDPIPQNEDNHVSRLLYGTLTFVGAVWPKGESRETMDDNVLLLTFVHDTLRVAPYSNGTRYEIIPTPRTLVKKRRTPEGLLTAACKLYCE